jgi:glycosyltransferase involved in cell wall biosynthesis
MPTPTFSILLPVYNAVHTLDDCIESVVSMNSENWTMVLVDDGSTDGSLELASRWARRDRRIVVCKRQHLGLVAALNVGLENCQGDWVLRLDSDDRMAPSRLADLQRSISEDADVGIWTGQVQLFPEQKLQKGLAHYLSWLNSLTSHEHICRDLFVESPLAHPAVSYRRRLILELGAYRDGPFPEDYDLWLRSWEHGVRFGKVPALSVYWRHHAGRLTFTDERYSPEAFRELKVRALCRTRLKSVNEFAMAGAGRDGKRFAKSLMNHGYKVAAWFELDPRKIGQTIYGAPVYSYNDLTALLAGPTKLPHILAGVGVKGARQIIRDLFLAHSLVETVDFTCVA